jgi:hypothetical protein
LGNNYFISYKYHDNQVHALHGNVTTNVRSYVDELVKHLNLSPEQYRYRGEYDGEDLSHLEESTIEKKLRHKLFYTSLTLILISPGMKIPYLAEKEQWIPWEVSYSLRNPTRENHTSGSNALLGIVLPDVHGQYMYFINSSTCSCGKMTYVTYSTNVIFDIMAKHICNRKSPVIHPCSQHSNQQIHTNNPSYMPIVRWDDFINRHQESINHALEINANIDEYTISKQIQ